MCMYVCMCGVCACVCMCVNVCIYLCSMCVCVSEGHEQYGLRKSRKNHFSPPKWVLGNLTPLLRLGSKSLSPIHWAILPALVLIVRTIGNGLCSHATKRHPQKGVKTNSPAFQGRAAAVLQWSSVTYTVKEILLHPQQFLIVSYPLSRTHCYGGPRATPWEALVRSPTWGFGALCSCPPFVTRWFWK